MAYPPTQQPPQPPGNPPQPSPGGTPPSANWLQLAQMLAGAIGSGGGSAPGAANMAQQFAATGNAGQPQPGGGGPAPGASSFGQQPPPWTPQTMIPGSMAQYGMPQSNGLMGQLPGVGGLPPVPQGQAGIAMNPGSAPFGTAKGKLPPGAIPGQLSKGFDVTVSVKPDQPAQQRKPRTASDGQTPQAKQPDQSRYTSRGPRPGMRWRPTEDTT